MEKSILQTPYTKHAKRPPLATVKELAAKFGVKTQVISSHMSHDPDSPKPVFDNRTHSRTAKLCWYDVAEFSKWITKRGLK